MTQVSILVVEDESIVNLSLCAILELQGYRVAGSAVSGEDALQKVEQAHPDLVLMDIHLAGMLDGAEAAQLIRQRFNVPVIFLTAYSDPDTLQRARQAEPFGFIVKPFKEQDLHTAITIALAKHASEQRLLHSQQRYRDIAEDMPVLVCRFQPDGVLTFANPLFSRYFAQPLEKLVGMNIFQFIPSEEHERVRARYLGLTAERPVTTYYHRVLSPDGSLRWLRRTDRAIFDEHHKLIEYQMVGEDITEQRQAEESLRQSESKFRDVVQQSQDGIALTDEEGLVIEWNPAMERSTGRSLFQVLGKPLWEVQFQSNPDLPPDSSYEQEVRQALKTGQAPWMGKAVEREYPRSDGSRRYLQSVTFPISTLKGFMLGSILRDVTERRRAEDAERAARRQAETLRQAMQALTSELNVDQVLDTVLQYLDQVTPYQVAFVALLESNGVSLKACRGLQELYLVGRSLELDCPLLALPDNEPQRFSGGEDWLFEHCLADLPRFASGIALPLRARSQRMGFLVAFANQPQAYSEADAQLAQTFADQAAIALENARLYEQAVYMSITDALTELFNRRKFFKLAGLEFERSRRYQTPFSVVTLDIDWFKKINDTYGHDTGDQALREVSRRLCSGVRSVDVVARIGGEEFAILLPETSLEEARQVAERLRAGFANAPVEWQGQQVPITASFGVTAMDENCADLEMMMKRADQALYRAKEGGRNQVVLWTP